MVFKLYHFLNRKHVIRMVCTINLGLLVIENNEIYLLTSMMSQKSNLQT
jgi:hypothetical protein